MAFDITSSAFTDPDEASALLSTKFAPVLLEPIAANTFDFQVSGATLPSLQIFRSTSNTGLRFASLGHFNGFTFSSITTGGASVQSGTTFHPIEPKKMLITDAETVDRLVMSEKSTVVGLSISAATLNQSITERIGAHADQRIAFQGNEVSTALATSCQGISDILHRGLVDDRHLVDNVMVIRHLQDALTNLILYGTEHNYSAALTAGAIELPKVVHRAIDFMHANAHLAITTTDVALELGIGLRSLQLSFKRWLDVTPHNYLRRIRLKFARQELLLGNEQKIGDIARRWGFLSSGEFSRLYQDAFGELPNDTLHRRSLRF